MQLFNALFVIAVVVMSAVVHELMHGVAADRLGDKTARYAGRLTLNPLPHIDPFGSVLLPALLALTNSPVLFGWAKPVPYNPYNLRPGRFSEAIVAGAGPFSNLCVALFAGSLMRAGFMPGASELLFVIVLVNIMMFIFNLVPIPPLDGSKIASALLPGPLAEKYDRLRARMEYSPLLGMGLVFLFIILAGSSISGVIWGIARAIAGA